MRAIIQFLRMSCICARIKCCRLKPCLMFVVAVFLSLVFLKSTHWNYTTSCHTERSYNDVLTLTQAEPTCKTYHVALVIATADEARKASYLLKTLVYHQRSSIYLHIFVNDLTRIITKTLLETWDNIQVEFYFYKIDDKNVSKFYWETLKYRLPDYIGKNVTSEVLYIGNDLRLLDDISVLWKEVVNDISGGKCLGLVTCGDGQEHCYMDQIAMFVLERFKTSALRSSLLSVKTKAEEDAILSAHREELTFAIPCSWAVPLTTTSNPSKCIHNSSPIKAVIQSDMDTTFIDNDPNLEALREHITTVLSSAPPLITHLECSTDPSEQQHSLTQSEPTDTRCSKFKQATRLKRRTHLYYLGNGQVQGKEDPYEVSLLTQLTIDRLNVLERLLKNWEGPATVVLHLSDDEAMSLDQRIKESSLLRNRKAVTYHIVYKRQIYNPINYLRNVAVNYSQTPYILFVDVDLVPNLSIYKNLKILIRDYMAERNTSKALIVPAFQMFNDLGDSTPKNKEELVKLMLNKTIVGYGMQRSWNLGHKPTNYEHWVTADKPYQAIFSDAYEPYVVVRKDFEARYNENLLERMGDKIAYVRLLHGQGYDLYVVPNDFIIHVPHPISAGSKRFYADKNYSRCSSVFFEAYRSELYKRYPGRKF